MLKEPNSGSGIIEIYIVNFLLPWCYPLISGMYFVVILHSADFKRNTICCKARETVCFFIVCENMATDEVMVSSCTAPASREDMIYIPSKLTVTVIVCSFCHHSASKIFGFRFSSKGPVPKPHGCFSIQIHKLFMHFHNCYGKMPLPPMMKSIQRKHVTDHRATYCYKPQRVILIIALQKISQLVFCRCTENVQFHWIAKLLYTNFVCV